MIISNNTALELISVNKSFSVKIDDHKSKNNKNTDIRVAILKNISLQVAKGEIVALIGPSGSGKTTLLQVAGLLDVCDKDSGLVIVDNIKIESSSCDKLRTETRKNNIGFIYQFHHLMPEFSALENVAMPLLIKGYDKKYAFKEAKQILTEVDLLDRVDYRISQLSGGQQQRVAIARAVISKPSIILADEPTGNLDSSISLKVFELLKNLTGEYKIGCLMVTHNNELAKKANRILSIKDGSLSAV